MQGIISNNSIDRQIDTLLLTKKNCKKAIKNIPYITFLQSLAVFLVIVGHSVPAVNEGNTSDSFIILLHDIIYSFHMPLFFVLSGFLLLNSLYRNSKNIINFKEFFKNKLKRLMLPYFVIGTIAYLLKAFLFNRFAYRPVENTFGFYLKSLIYPWDNPNISLWFLPTIFIILITGYFVIKNIKPTKKYLPTIFLSSLLISVLSKYTNIFVLNFSGVLYYFFYFILGFVIYEFREKIFSVLENTKIICLLFFLYVILFVIGDSEILKYIIASLGIFLSFALTLICVKKNKKFLFGIMDGKYYQVYLLHWFFMPVFRILYQLNLINFRLAFILMIIAQLFGPLITIKVINKYLPRLKVFIGE